MRFKMQKPMNTQVINAYIDSSKKVADMGIIIGKTGCWYGYLAWKEMIRILLLK